MRARGAARAPKNFAGRWRLEQYNRTITMRVDGNRVLMYDPEVGGTGSGTVTRTSAGTLKLTGRGRSQFGPGGFTMELSADGNSFTGTWAIGGGTSGTWRGRRIN